jgi:LPXTG-motif cell wall-anchored protein
MRVRRWAAFAVPCLVISLFLVLGPIHLHQARAAGIEEQRLLELIKGYRQENGVGPLVPSEVLSTSAQRHSEDMATHGFLSHSTKESSYYPSGSSPADRAAREGYPTNVYTAENIALGQQTAEEVFEDWRGASEHNAAMLGEQYTAAGIGHAGSYWTADFGSVADTPPSLEIFEPYAGRIVESATGEQSSRLPSAAEQTTGEREGDEQPTDDERSPEEQTQLEGTQPEAQQDVTVENEPVAGETATTGQTSTPQQTTAVQAPDGTAPTTENTPDPGSNEETTLGTVTSSQPLTGDTGAEQHTVETTRADILSPLGEELAIGDLDAGTIVPEAVTEEGFHRVSPVETEAMETALAIREDVPEDLVWQAPSVPEQPIEGPAADQSPAASGLGSSGGGVAGLTPLATKELPETSAASPLTLVLGGFLLLCGFLVFGAARKQRGS